MYIEQDNKEFDKIIGTVRLVLSLCENHSLIFSFVQKVADVEFKYLGEAKTNQSAERPSRAANNYIYRLNNT